MLLFSLDNHMQEYGITVEEKLDIAEKICSPLLGKIQEDLRRAVSNEQRDVIHRLDPLRSKGVDCPDRHVRTRLYFTSESHVHSLVNILKYDGLIKVIMKPTVRSWIWGWSCWIMWGCMWRDEE